MEILESTELYRALLDQSPDGIVVVGADGRFAHVNARACEMLGYEPEELRGMAVAAVVDPEDLVRSPLGHDDVGAHGRAIGKRVPVRKSGERITVEEVVSRVRALLRRRSLDLDAAAPGSVLAGAGVSVDLVRNEVSVDGRRVAVTPSELKLLTLLMGEPGRTYTRTQIMKCLWESSYVGDSRAADAHIATLRKKVERDAKHPERVVTVRGFGYRFAG